MYQLLSSPCVDPHSVKGLLWPICIVLTSLSILSGHLANHYTVIYLRYKNVGHLDMSVLSILEMGVYIYSNILFCFLLSCSLETTLRNFSCLTSGDSIMVAYNNKKYYIDIIETKPASAISIIETDCEVDFAPPLDYKEPEKPAAPVPLCKALSQGLCFFIFTF